MTDDGNRRYRVRPDAFYVRSDDGVWLRNNKGSLSIRGASAYQLVALLFANLDGERTVDEFCDGLPENARQSVSRLVDTLARNGFLKDVTRHAEEVPDWMRDRYASHLAFLDHHGDRPVARMLRARSQTVAVVGTGVALHALLGALADFGLARVLIVTDERGREAACGLLDAGQRDDPGFRWRTVVAGRDLDLAEVSTLSELDEARIVLMAGDTDDYESVARAQAALRDRVLGVGVLGRCGDFVVCSAPDPDDGSCWECVRRWFAAPVQGSASDLAPAVAPATVAALHLAQHTFIRLAGLDTEITAPVTSAEPLVPVVRTHARRRHPGCRRHPAPPAVRMDPAVLSGEPVRPDIPAPEDPPDLVAVADRIVTATAAWTDQVVGPLLSLGEDDGEQLPLAISHCRVADPAVGVRTQVTELVACRALSPREARNQAVLFALEHLAARVSRAAFGAGWSPAEAWYRAQAAASLALPPAASSAWLPAVRGVSQARGFLADTLAEHGSAWFASAFEHLPTGFVRARVRTEDGAVASAVGTDVDHAIDNALLRAVSAVLPEAGAVRVAHLAPPADSWAEAVAMVTKSGGTPLPTHDVSGLLAFLGTDACLAAVGWPQ